MQSFSLGGLSFGNNHQYLGYKSAPMPSGRSLSLCLLYSARIEYCYLGRAQHKVTGPDVEQGFRLTAFLGLAILNDIHNFQFRPFEAMLLHIIVNLCFAQLDDISAFPFKCSHKVFVIVICDVILYYLNFAETYWTPLNMRPKKRNCLFPVTVRKKIG